MCLAFLLDDTLNGLNIFFLTTFRIVLTPFSQKKREIKDFCEIGDFHIKKQIMMAIFCYFTKRWDLFNYFLLFSFQQLVNYNFTQKYDIFQTLRKKCLYSELLWSAFFLHFPEFGLYTERYGVPLCIQSECGKMREKCGPE